MSSATIVPREPGGHRLFPWLRRVDMAEAEAAVKESREALLAAKEQAGRVKELGESFDRIRERNHFADQMTAIITSASANSDEPH